ncbi:MAG: Ig-like domain repeat protein, partial [Candidatus Bipolaricaulis anaerobius]|nr:Ig-like domain repeat protein [Candidatus Bipolaricaulis anaerobius]
MNWFAVGDDRMGRTPRRSGRALVLALSFVLGLGLVGIAQTTTTTSLGSDVNPSVYGQSVAFTATVSPTPNGGTVTFKDGATVLGSVPVDTPTGVAKFSTSSLSVGTHSITAEYSGTTTYQPSTSSPLTQTVNKQSTTTTVFGSDTPLVVGDTVTCTVRVVDTSPGEASMPTGNVTVSVSPTGQGTPTSWSHALVAADAGEFTFTYTPTSGETTPHTFTATYDGDSTHSGSSGSFAQAIIKRAADIQLVLDPTTAYIGQPVTVTVRVEDDTTAGTVSVPIGTVAFSDGTKNGVFSSDTADLSGGTCTVTYTPGAGDAGTTTITATYSGSSVHTAKSTTQLLTVNLRPTRTKVQGSNTTILVNQQISGTVTVEDIAGVGTATPPLGVLSYSSSLPAGYATIVPAGAPPSATFTYRCHGLDAEAGYDTIRADYTATDGIHADSAGAFGQGIQRRPTVTTLSGCVSTATGVSCTATVAEKSGIAGDPALITGDVVLLGDPDVTKCSGLVGMSLSCGFTTDSEALYANVTVRFDPTNKVHLASSDSENVDRSDQFPPAPDDGSTGANCTDGCGSGGVDVAQILYNLQAADVALAAVQMGLDAAAIAIDVIPDVIVGGGVFVISGVTIPVSDIAAAIIAGSSIALEIARTAMTTDLDGDGLPDVVENTVTGTDPTKWDTDDDGLSDADEIFEAGGFYGGSRRPNPNVADSDGDGLSDGDEAGLYNTSFCVGDTDCDTISDGAEVATWGCDDPRDHADPLVIDTDGDGLNDKIEFSAFPCASCPYVNDDDSDDDGLQDGYEDTNNSGSYEAASDVSNLCDADTDDDGLLDGVEVGLGTGPENQDTDGDGLSDYEEVHATQTDPLNTDSDNDGLNDDDEVFVLGGTYPNRSFDQESDPLDPDTDDDGIRDDKEFPGGTVSGTLRDTTCPYVNDDDSDDDGLQDGYEDTNRNGNWDYTQIGNSTTQGSGEMNPCDPDTDDDGLLDGEEEGLLGRTATPQGVSTMVPLGTSAASAGYTVLPGAARGTGNDLLAPYTFAPAPGPSLPQTVPALDTDSDNDGLSDYEEVNVTATDPLDADTDSDTLFDADELVAVSGTWPNRQFDQVSDPLNINTDRDHLFDPQEFSGSGLSALVGALGGTRDMQCPFVNDDDSDDDGIQDGAVVVRTFVAVGVTYSWTHYEDFADVTGATDAAPGTVRTVVTPAGGEQNDDS